MCPVSAPSTAIWAVSRSRISPTISMSGSARIIERSPLANVSPAFGLIWIWVIPSIWYSTGSSIVMIPFSGLLSSVSAAYSVVDFPEPVGPVTSTAPCARWNRPAEPLQLQLLHPELLEIEVDVVLVQDPQHDRLAVTLGSVTTRTSTCRPSTVSPTRPSCGMRRSEMSRSLMILIRETTPGDHPLGHRHLVGQHAVDAHPDAQLAAAARPSRPGCGSKWMSDAPRSAASAMIECTSLITGASSADSRRSTTSSGPAPSSPSSTASWTASSKRFIREIRLCDVLRRGDRRLDLEVRHQGDVVGRQHVGRVGHRQHQRLLVRVSDRDRVVALGRRGGEQVDRGHVDLEHAEVEVVEPVPLGDRARELLLSDRVLLEQHAAPAECPTRAPP